MKKQFVRTANFVYINLDFVKSICYVRKEYDDLGEFFKIVLECIEDEVILGCVIEEEEALDIINDIIDGKVPTNEYLNEVEIIQLLKRRKECQKNAGSKKLLRNPEL